MAVAPAILWTVADVTARNLLVVKQLEIGSYAKVLAGAGSQYQAVAAGTGASCWAQVASSSDDPADLEAEIVALDARLDVVEAADTERVYGSLTRPPLAADLLVTADVAYWVYQGYFPYAKTFGRVRFFGGTGVGAQTAEVALASSPAAPNRANQVLTKIVADDTLNDLTTAAGLKSNGNSLSTVVPAGTHLWAGIRCAMATTQPTFKAVGGDLGQGNILTTAAAGALTGAGPWTGVVVTHAETVGLCPALITTLD